MSKDDINIGLGTLLRHFVDLLDQGSKEAYEAAGLEFRPRYTPVMRALKGEEALSVTQLQELAFLTQGAVSQTIKLMEADGLVCRITSDDARSRPVALTNAGRVLQNKLYNEWQARLAAIEVIESEIDTPLRSILRQAIESLSRNSFSSRIQAQKLTKSQRSL